MPQWRKLHVKTTESFDVNDMPDDFTRLLWVLLTLKVCKEGRGLDMPAWVKSQIFPLRSDVSPEQVEDALRWYQDRGMINRYTADDRPYFEIVKWHEYQNTSRDAPSPYPSFENRNRKEKKEDIDIDIEGSQTGMVKPGQDKLQSNSGVIQYTAMIEFWSQHFPGKPQPRPDNKTLQGKVKTRLKTTHFQESWRASLLRAGKSDLCHSSDWFRFGWFVQNDNNYEKCLNGNYDNKQENFSTSPAESKILAHMKKYGARQQPSFDADTDRVMLKAGGYRKLCQMSGYDAVKAIRSAQKETAT